MLVVDNLLEGSDSQWGAAECVDLAQFIFVLLLPRALWFESFLVLDEFLFK
jgi:hypothetical protein